MNAKWPLPEQRNLLPYTADMRNAFYASNIRVIDEQAATRHLVDAVTLADSTPWETGFRSGSTPLETPPLLHKTD